MNIMCPQPRDEAEACELAAARFAITLEFGFHKFCLDPSPREAEPPGDVATPKRISAFLASRGHGWRVEAATLWDVKLVRSTMHIAGKEKKKGAPRR